MDPEKVDSIEGETELEKCQYCHAFYDDGTFAGIPRLETCMECHDDPDSPLGESPEEEKFMAAYVADEKELVHLKNPQCAGQFPVKWDEHTLPECYLGNQWIKPDRAPDIRGSGHRKLQVDYITVFHQQAFWEAEDEEKWQQILDEHYELVIITSRELAALYRRKQKD